MASVNAPPDPFFNEPFDFQVTFDNADTDDVGYGPYIDLELPPGVQFHGAEYLGVTVSATQFTCGGGGSYVHPMTGQTFPCTSGNLVVVLELPFGSFAPGQPPTPITVHSGVNGAPPSLVGSTRTIRATGGFRYGADPLDNAGTDPPLRQPGAATADVIPALIKLRKEYIGPEDETATGPNFPRQYRIVGDVANGQTLTAFSLTDRLPNNLAYLGASAASPGGGSITTAPAVGVPSNTPNNLVVGSWPSVTGTLGDADAVMTVDWFVPLNDADGSPVIDASSGDDANSINDAAAAGTWTATGGAVTSDATSNDYDIEPKSIAIQKSFTNVTDTVNSPGDVLEWTLQVQVSDFFVTDQLVVTDEWSDGQNYDAGFAPTLSWASSGGASGGGSFTVGTNLTIAEPVVPALGGLGTGWGRAVFDLSALTGGAGKLIGGCVPPAGTGGPVPNCSTYDDGATTATIVFRTVIQQTFENDFPSGDPSVDQGDSLPNNVDVTARLLGVADAATPTGQTESDRSAATPAIPVGTVGKSLVFINGLPPTPGQRALPGDVITYRLEYSHPTGDFEAFSMTDYLPLPALRSDEVGTWTQFLGAGAPPAGQWSIGPTDTFTGNGALTPPGTLPTVSAAGPPANTLTFDYGSYDSASGVPHKIDLYFSVTVRDDPFADGLFLTNQVRATEANTESAPSTEDKIVQIQLGEPVLQIRKGVTATDNANAALQVAPCNATAPVTTLNARLNATSSASTRRMWSHS